MAERRNITQPADWWAAWEAQAAKEGLPLSTWIGERCNEGLSKKAQRQLSERVSRGRPRTPVDVESDDGDK